MGLPIIQINPWQPYLRQLCGLTTHNCQLPHWTSPNLAWSGLRGVCPELMLRRSLTGSLLDLTDNRQCREVWGDMRRQYDSRICWIIATRWSITSKFYSFPIRVYSLSVIIFRGDHKAVVLMGPWQMLLFLARRYPQSFGIPIGCSCTSYPRYF